MKEDELTNHLTPKKKEPKSDRIVHSEPEAHYNHYGTRGVADLYLKKKESPLEDNTDVIAHLYEIKANPSSANEVIRQFNKMRNYFFRDSQRKIPDEVMYELCFTPEISNYRHIVKNLSMYRSLYQNNERVRITFRHPEVNSPCQLFAKNMTPLTSEFFEHAETVGLDKVLDLEKLRNKKGVTSDE